MKKLILLLFETMLIGIVAFVAILMVLYLKDSEIYRYTKESAYQIAVEKLSVESPKEVAVEKRYCDLYILGAERRYVVFERNYFLSKYRIVTVLGCPKEDAEIIVTGSVRDYIFFTDERGDVNRVERLSASKTEAARWCIIGVCVLFFVKEINVLNKQQDKESF